LYWGATLELQIPFFFLPKDTGIRGAIYTDVGSIWDYKGPTSWAVTGETIIPSDSSAIRASAGVGIIWDSPFGPLRFDLAFPYMKQSYDRTQVFRFSGGTSF
jgi:outer membrane protein insertion porin family